MKSTLQVGKFAEQVLASSNSAGQSASTSFGSLVNSIASRRALRGRPINGSKAPVEVYADYDLLKLDKRLRRHIHRSRRGKSLDISAAVDLVERHLQAKPPNSTESPLPTAPSGSRLPAVVYESQGIAARKASKAVRENAFTSSILLLLSQPNYSGVAPALQLCQQQLKEGLEPDIKVVTALLQAAVNVPSTDEVDIAPLIGLALQSHTSQSLDMQAFTLVGQLMISRCGSQPAQIEQLVRDCMVAEGYRDESEWPLSVWDIVMSAQRHQGDLLGALGVFKRYRAALDSRAGQLPTGDQKAVITLTMPYMTILSLYLDIRNSTSIQQLPPQIRATFPNLPHILTEDLKSRISSPPTAYFNLLFSAQRQAGDVKSAWRLWELISTGEVEAAAWANVFKLYRHRDYRDCQVARPELRELAWHFLKQREQTSKSPQAVNALIAASVDQATNSIAVVENLELVVSIIQQLAKAPTRHLITSSAIDMILAAVIRLVKRNVSLRSAVYGDFLLSPRSRWTKQDASGVTAEEWRLMTKALSLHPAITFPLTRPVASVHSIFPAPSLKGLASLTHFAVYPASASAAARSQMVLEPLLALLKKLLASSRNPRSLAPPEQPAS